jgi:hypothetical protein
MANYENFNNSSKSFRIFCDKLSSTNTSNNLILESSYNSIQLKVGNDKRIIFNDPVVFNNSMDLNNKSLRRVTTISAENLILNNIFKSSILNIVDKSTFASNSSDSNNQYLTYTNQTQNLANLLFNTITIFNNSSVIVTANLTLYCSYAVYERITIELWRDSSMILQSKDLGSVNAGGGISIPYSITYLDENLTVGSKKYYIKYKLENQVTSIDKHGIINLNTSETAGYSSITLKEVFNTTNHYNKTLFDASSITTTSYETQDLSAQFYNIINVVNSDVQVNINANLYCSYAFNEQLTIEVWRDSSMISQSVGLGSLNATGGLTIPYSFNYLDTNLSNGLKKYYLKYKIEGDPTSNNSSSYEPQGIVNISTLNSIGTSNILLENVTKYNNTLTIDNSTNYLTSANNDEYVDLSDQLYTNVAVSAPSVILIDFNITLFCCYAFQERITVELWRDLVLVSQNINIGNINATGGLNINYRLTLADEDVNAGTVKYYLKYKLESNLSAQPQGIINLTGYYNIIEKSRIGVSYKKVLSYNKLNSSYITNTVVGYNPIIEGDRGSATSMRDAYFTNIDVNGTDTTFNNSIYVKNNINVVGSTTLTSDLNVRTISLATMLAKLNFLNDYITNMANNTTDFSNTKITSYDLSASTITISNELYSLNKYYANDLNISGQLLSNVLRVPDDFTLDPFGFYNNSGSFTVNGDLIVRGLRKIIKSSVLDISAYTIKIATNLKNKNDLMTNPAGLDVSYIAALHYDGTMWDVSGGNLLVANQLVGLDISLIYLQTTVSGALIASKSKYDSSFSLLQTNIDNSFNKLVYYSKSNMDNSFVTLSYAVTGFNELKNYIDLSFVTNQAFSISGEYIVQNYVTKAYVDGSFIALNNKVDLSYVLKTNFELSYNSLNSQFDSSFANVAATNVDISSITIENIRTPRLALNSNVSISGDLLVSGDSSCNSLTISNNYSFSNNGYSSVYFNSSTATAIMEEYFSKSNSYLKVFYINADGSLYNLNNSRGAISDSRLKENIVDASPKLEDLLKVRIVDYNLKASPNKKYIGVVAQELEELFPNLVETESSDTQTTNYKTVKYSCFNVMLIKALQEQQIIINNLTLRLERLKFKKQKQKQKQKL